MDVFIWIIILEHVLDLFFDIKKLLGNRFYRLFFYFTLRHPFMLILVHKDAGKLISNYSVTQILGQSRIDTAKAEGYY